VTDTVSIRRLTQAGALKALHACIAKAEAMKVPQCIAVTDEGGHLLAFARMDGAKVLSIDSSTAKARTSASSRVQTGTIHAEVEIKLALATDNKLTNLKGGVPIVIGGQVVGAIGVGSGTGEQDREVALAGVAAIDGATAG
jgi:glc operon protein GlcG